MTYCALKKREVIHLKTDIQQSKRYSDKQPEFFPYKIKYDLNSSPYFQLPPYHWWLVRVSMWNNFHVSYFAHSY